MKLYIFAAILVVSGISGLGSDQRASGLICIVIGVFLFAGKVIADRERQSKQEEAEAEIRRLEAEARAERQSMEESRRRWELEEQERLRKSEAWNTVHLKWKAIIDEHNRLVDEIGMRYTIANNLGLPNSPQMTEVIELCKQDIALAELFQQSQAEIQQVRVANGWAEADGPIKGIVSFPTFKRLAIIYEKQKDYDNAIAVCKRAIELGYVDDGTDGQMPGRVARLMRKAGNLNKKIPAPVDVDSEFKED